MYAYWRLESEAPPNMVLRFHDQEDSSQFDVQVDVRLGMAYISLWSPGRSYCAELGAQSSEGLFTSFLRSNTVQTPRAWPMMKVEERFARVAAAERPPLRMVYAPAPPPPAPVKVARREIASAAAGPDLTAAAEIVLAQNASSRA